MKTVIIEGRVLPERRFITIDNLEPISYKDPRGFDAEFEIKVKESKIRIECTLHTQTDFNPQMCIVRAYELVTAAVDLYAFTKAWALDVILDDFTLDGQTQGIAFSETSAASFSTAISSENDFNETYKHLLGNFHLKFAFRDLISSLNTLNYSAIAASRALETIRKSIAPDGSSDSESWNILREKLQIERSYIQFITNASREPRHGNRATAFGEEQLEITHRVWKIMNRYIEYLKSGEDHKLPKDKFPLLKE